MPIGIVGIMGFMEYPPLPIASGLCVCVCVGTVGVRPTPDAGRDGPAGGVSVMRPRRWTSAQANRSRWSTEC